MKINNRGFLLAESLIVSTFVLTVLMLLYIQFDNLTTNYKNSYNYNNVESIYDLSSVSNYLLANNYNLSDKLTEQKPYVIIYKDESCNMDAGIVDSFCDNLINKMGAKTIIYTSSDISVIQNYVSSNDDTNINQNLREFISRVETNTIQNKGRLFAEFNNGTYATIALDNKTISPDEMSPIKLCQSGNLATSGDGLYADTYETGRCIYKGANPNNYITFNNETWRIISVEKDGTVKIMRNESIGMKVFDSRGYRDNTSEGAGGTYCAEGDMGCNAWAINDNFVNGNFSGTVLKDASLNTYLNGEYLNSITTNKDKIKTNASWSIGGVNRYNTDFAGQIASENGIIWQGSIALPTVSEYLRANTNVEQCGNVDSNYTNRATCVTTNWIYNIVSSNDLLLLTPIESPDSVFSVYGTNMGGGYVDRHPAFSDADVAPTLYLTSDITLTGTGSQTEPYQIQ